MTKKQVLGFKPAPDLNKSIMNIPSDCRIASILLNYAMILPHDANPKPDGIFGKDRAGTKAASFDYLVFDYLVGAGEMTFTSAEFATNNIGPPGSRGRIAAAYLIASD